MIYDFNNPEHFSQLEKQAYNGTVDVSGFPPAAYRYFDSLKKIYEQYRLENLSKEQAENKKRILLSQYRETIAAYEKFRAVAVEHQDNIRRLGTLLSDIEKSQTAEEIALKACECLQILTGDTSFLKRQENKIREKLK